MSDPVEYQEHGLSAAQGKIYFDELGGGDPYATGIAYPMLLAMMEAFPADLGPDTAAKVAAMTEFDPDDAWTPVPPQGG